MKKLFYCVFILYFEDCFLLRCVAILWASYASQSPPCESQAFFLCFGFYFFCQTVYFVFGLPIIFVCFISCRCMWRYYFTLPSSAYILYICQSLAWFYFHALLKSQKLNSVHSVPVHLVPAHWTHSLLPSASHLTSCSLMLPENGVPVLVRVTFRSSLLRCYGKRSEGDILLRVVAIL